MVVAQLLSFLAWFLQYWRYIRRFITTPPFFPKRPVRYLPFQRFCSTIYLRLEVCLTSTHSRMPCQLLYYRSKSPSSKRNDWTRRYIILRQTEYVSVNGYLFLFFNMSQRTGWANFWIFCSFLFVFFWTPPTRSVTFTYEWSWNRREKIFARWTFRRTLFPFRFLLIAWSIHSAFQFFWSVTDMW